MSQDTTKTKQELLKEIQILKVYNRELEDQVVALSQPYAKGRLSPKNFSSRLADSGADLIYIFSIEQRRMLFISRHVKEITGFSQQDVIGFGDRLLEEMVHPQDLKPLQNHLQSLVETQSDDIFEIEYRVRTLKGNWRWIYSKERPYERDESGLVTELIGSAEDITERKVAEEALRQSEDRMRAVFDNTNAGIVTVDSLLRIHQVNERFADMLGYSMRELKGKVVMQLTAPYRRDEVRGTMAELLCGATLSMNREQLLLTKKGKSFWVSLSATLQIDGDGQPYVLAVVVDIDRLKNTEQALRDSESKYRALVENSPDLIFRLDKKLRLEFLNQSTSQFFNLDINKALQSKFSELALSKSTIKFFRDKTKEVLVNNQPITAEVELFLSNKSYYLESRFQPEHDAMGKLKSVLIVCRDMTLQRTSQRNYRLLFKRMLDGFAVYDVVYDDEGKISDFICRSVNPAFERLTGLKAKNVLGKTLKQVSPDMEKEWKENYAIVARTGEARRVESNFRGLRKYFEALVFAPHEKQIAVIFQETTERRHLEDRLLHSQKMEAIGTLAGGVAHDFNNILAALLAYSDFALHDLHDIRAVEGSIKEIKQASLRAKDLVSQILSFSRPAENEMRPVKLQKVVREVTGLLKGSIPSSIEIRQHIDNRCGLVEADPAAMHQLIMNLCTNAYHAMRPYVLSAESHNKDSILEVKLSKNGYDLKGDRVICPLKQNALCLMVKDTGCGMDKETHLRIFEPYFTTKDKSEGSGLGMAIVHSIVVAHSGVIELDTEPNMGTVFRVWLPLVKSGVETKQTVMGNISKDIKGTGRILFVDDEQMLTRVGKAALERLGYDVTTCNSGVEALEVFSKDPDWFDLVVTDLTMPKMNGLELARKLLEHKDCIPILLCTGYSESDTDKKAREIGIKKCLLKPIDTNDLASAIRSFLS